MVGTSRSSAAGELIVAGTFCALVRAVTLPIHHGARAPRTGRARHNGLVPARRRPNRPLSIASSHWRSDGRAKTRFPDAARAWAAATERSAESGVELTVYACEVCSGWHMGRPHGRDET